MKGFPVSLVLLGLVVGSLANSSSLKDALDLVADKDNLANELAKISMDDLIVSASALQKDMNEALKIAKKIAALDGILDENFRLKKTFESLSEQFGSIFYDVEMDVRKLPDLADDMDDWVFLDQCVEDGRKTDFNKITDKRDFINIVFQKVFECQVSGIQYAMDIVDLSGVSQNDLTKQMIGERLVFLENGVVEMAHLIKFKNDFVISVLADYDTSSHNELVHDLIGGSDLTSPSPSPAGPKRTHPPPKDSKEDDDKRGGKRPRPTPTGPTKTRPPKDSSEEDDGDDENGISKPPRSTPAGPKGTRPPKESSEEDDDDDEDDDVDERTLILRILDILQGSKRGGRKRKSKGSPKPPKPTPSGPTRTRPPKESSEEDDNDSDYGKGRSKPPRTTPSGPQESSEENDDDDDDDDDKRSMPARLSYAVRGGTKGRKGKSKGSPKPPKPTPSGPTKTRPPKESSEEDDDDSDAGKGRSKPPRTTPSGPKRTRPPKESSEEDDDDDEERSLILRILNMLQGGKKAGRKGKSKGSPKPPKPTPSGPTRTRPPKESSEEDDDDSDDGKGRSKPPRTTPSGPQESSEENDDDEDDDDRSMSAKLSQVVRGGNKAGRKGKSKGSPKPPRPTPSGPTKTRPPKESSEEDDDDKGSRKPPRPTPSGPTRTRPPKESSEEEEDDDDDEKRENTRKEMETFLDKVKKEMKGLASKASAPVAPIESPKRSPKAEERSLILRILDTLRGNKKAN